jgi:hypothetical protein
MPSRDDYDDRPKRSWSEIDKMRDGKRSSSRSSDGGGNRSQLERSGTYSRYKSAADKFFSGELIPDALREKVDPTGEGKARQDALKKLKDADDFKQFVQLAKEYVAAHGMPEDPYLLDRLLSHPSDDIVLKALNRITELVAAGEFKVPKSLGQRLKSLELSSDSPDVQDTAKALEKELKSKSML